jgi:hypothetical protein
LGEPAASGRAFLGLVRHIKDKHGAAVLSDIVAGAGPVAAPIFSSKITVVGWYPYPAFTAFLVSADKRLGKGDGQYCRTLGAVAGERDLGSIFRIYVALASAERLIRGCSRVWPSYYRDCGAMEALKWRPEETVLRISGFPKMHPHHCRLMEGWMISTMAQLGLKVADDGEIECPSRGGTDHVFSCTWSKAKK